MLSISENWGVKVKVIRWPNMGNNAVLEPSLYFKVQGSNFCQLKTLIWAVLSISENNSLWELHYYNCWFCKTMVWQISLKVGQRLSYIYKYSWNSVIQRIIDLWFGLSCCGTMDPRSLDWFSNVLAVVFKQLREDKRIQMKWCQITIACWKRVDIIA